MIKGIQIKGKIICEEKGIVYIVDFEKMTIDTDKKNRIITSGELEEIIEDNPNS